MFFLFCLPSSLFAIEYSNNGSKIGDKTLSLKKGDSFTINFDHPYGILFIRDWMDCVIKLDVKYINDESDIKSEKLYSDLKKSKLIGVYLHETIGTVTFLSLNPTILSVSWAIFPNECDLKYVQNVKNGGIQLHQSSIDHGSMFCFYSSAPAPLRYSIHYNLTQDQVVTIIRPSINEKISISQVGTLSKNCNESSIITISDNIHENINFLEIIASSLSNKTVSETAYSDYILYDSLTYIIINDDSAISSNKMKFTIFSILGAVIAVFLVIFSLIGFRRRKHPNVIENLETDSSSEVLSRPPTPEHIQIEQFQSDSADGDDHITIQNAKDEFSLDYEGYPQNDYNPSNVEYQAPKPVLLKTVLNEVNAKT